ncbi:MAG: hypothetical protein ABIP30_16700 [Ferruginibacter sp.]
MNIIQRVQAPTPGFFKKLRNISLILTTLGASVLAAPVALPALALKIAGYLFVAGGVGTTVSQAVTVQDEKPKTGGDGSSANE